MKGDHHEEVKPHRCKVCGKDFPCGRSLGGHMRSHMSLGSPYQELCEKPQKRHGLTASGAAYGLRENPKRTWRISEQGRCGKGFASQNSPFGHMKSHSEVAEEVEDMEQEQGVEEPDGFLESQESENEVTVPRKRRRSRRVMSIPWSSSSPCKIDKEQEDVALSLMMLSRGIELCCSVSSAAESDDGNMVVDSGNVCQRNGLKKLDYDVSYDEFAEDDDSKMQKSYICDSDDFKYFDKASMNCFKKKQKSLNGSKDYDAKSSTKLVEIDSHKVPKKRSRYKCLICNKSFHSYQALGGHQSSHMRMKGCIESGTNSSTCKNNIERNVNIATGSDSSKKVKEYKCPICCKVFSSGQALGGHKRSHFLTNSSYYGFSACQQTMVIQQQPPTMPVVLDLNLPASAEEDSKIITGNIKFKSWWVKSNAEHEPMDADRQK